jgi:hypothetical protein
MDDGSITPCGTYAPNFKQIASFERNRRHRREFNLEAARTV